MSKRRATKGRRAALALAMAAAVAVAGAGCGEGDDPKASVSASSPTTAGGEKGQDTATGPQPDPNVKLAEIRGQGDLLLVINEAKRDSGGFVTVSGEIRNQSDEVRNSSGWEGAESTIIAKNPNSVAGGTLVDKVNKKRYYVLRDTDGRCLCTTGILPIQPGKATPVFMQFPAPPSGTSEVDFSLPTFTNTTIKIAG
ncbi:hypothetical protein [Streptomyces sp. NPDC006368]|uniref:hypothetical protein n=1 Tax=Streptomyces sp. NPDC006368 TaxID=3156760 RepID=UPI0033B82CE7